MKFDSKWAAAGALGIGMVLAASPLIAQEAKTAAKKVADGVAHRPTGIPDRIILTFKGDPARAIGVTWRTDNTVLPGEATVQIAEATAYPKFEEKARVVAATSTPVSTDLGPAHFHGAELTGLTPNTLYAYRVGDGANWSEWIHFRTASDKPEPFTFIYFGDAQNDIKSLWSRAIRSAYSDAPKARFMIHAGDLINNANTDAQWGEWHTAGGWVNAMMPSLPSPGNHEYNGTPKSLSGHWRPQFTLPENGPAGLEETCYYVDYQGVRIISLNTEEQTDAQVPWLDKVLANNPNRWTVLTFHRPMFSSAKGRDNKALREAWMPVFDKHKVDLVLQGHDHTYARSKNIRAGMNVKNDASGTVYVVSVSGPKMYNLEREDWMARTAEDTQLYQVISVDNGKLRYEARTVTGELYDAFELQKRGDKTNKLVERVPKNEPERLRPLAPSPAPSAAAK
ncbi:MAG: metallophosphoesterase family protein [Fibrella sp.]|nr:metallophosphoesterase family protein [Armatimonadota bacterium]